MSTFKRSFQAGSGGEFPTNCSLKPDGVYVLQQAQPTAGAFPDRTQLIAWIRNCVLGDLRTLRVGISVYLADERRFGAAGLAGANFLLAAGCSTALEYLARIFKGDLNSVENVRSYAQAFLTPRYAEVADLLQRVLRNGLIHGSWPKTFCLESDPSTRITVGIGVRPEDPHLAPVPGWPGYSFGINAVRFLEDLESSVNEGFAPWIAECTDNSVLERGAPGLLVVSDDDAARKQVQRIVQWNDESRTSG